MAEIRRVDSVSSARATREGAGVHLMRVFGEVDARLDPFLLLDHFGSDKPEDYLAGFPWHPHRGIETITYMLSGEVEHADSLGNQGLIGPGDVQWMTAGSGIVHQEMPKKAPVLEGFQLWSNLPKAHKMMDPRYQGVAASDLPSAELGPGALAKVICGRVAGVSGPVQDIATDPLYLDLSLQAGAELTLDVGAVRNAFAYLYRGAARLGPAAGRTVTARELAIFGPGDQVRVLAGDAEVRLLLVAGKPIREPVAWGGPIVMNTQEELRQAFAEYEDGTFLKNAKK